MSCELSLRNAVVLIGCVMCTESNAQQTVLASCSPICSCLKETVHIDEWQVDDLLMTNKVLSSILLLRLKAHFSGLISSATIPLPQLLSAASLQLLPLKLCAKEP